MDFYKTLSTYYDDIFPTKAMKVAFIEQNLNKGDRVLDVACGTGNYVIALAERGYESYGIDLDEDMIEQARGKVEKKGLSSHLTVGDMKVLRDIYEAEYFQSILCIGNSLVHLDSLEDIEMVLKQFYSLLKPGGEIVIQIINYDRILNKRIDHLPTIDCSDDGIRFVRNYDFIEAENKISFNTRLEVEKHGRREVAENSVLLLPVKQRTLRDLLEKVGFKHITLFGDFKGAPYREDTSYPMIIRAKKL